jgi:hypothetical protein
MTLWYLFVSCKCRPAISGCVQCLARGLILRYRRYDGAIASGRTFWCDRIGIFPWLTVPLRKRENDHVRMGSPSTHGGE